MIVVDTNILAYLLLSGERTTIATAVLQKDPAWAMPLLGRSEFRNVLALYLRKSILTWPETMEAVHAAERLLSGREYAVPSKPILDLVRQSSCSAYDCEFVALAQQLGVPLITDDKKVLREFPAQAMTPERFLDLA